MSVHVQTLINDSTPPPDSHTFNNLSFVYIILTTESWSLKLKLFLALLADTRLMSLSGECSGVKL